MNSYFVKITKRKVKSVIKRNVEEGKVHGRSPYGYRTGNDNKLEVDEEQSKIIKLIYNLREKGYGDRKISEYLNDNDIPSRYKNMKGDFTHVNPYTNEVQIIPKSEVKWSHSTIRRIRKDTLYKGERKFKGKTYQVPKIISPEQWERVQKVNLPSGKNTQHKWLLNDVLICGGCGKRMVGRNGGDKGGKFYRCVTRQYKGHTCKNRSIQSKYLEDFLWETIIYNKNLEKTLVDHFHNTDIDKKRTELKEDISTLEKNIKPLEKEKDRIIHLSVKGILSDEELRSEKSRVDNRLKDLNTLLQHKKDTLGNYSNMENTLNYLDEDLQIKVDGKVIFELTQEERFIGGLLDSSFDQIKGFYSKWIESITVLSEKPYYTIDIVFNVPEIKKVTYTMDRYYRWCNDSNGKLVWSKNIPKF